MALASHVWHTTTGTTPATTLPQATVHPRGGGGRRASLAAAHWQEGKRLRGCDAAGRDALRSSWPEGAQAQPLYRSTGVCRHAGQRAINRCKRLICF